MTAYSVTNELTNSLKGTQTYDNLIEVETSSEQLYRDLQNVFGEEFSKESSENIIIAIFVVGKNHAILALSIEENKLKLTYYSVIKEELVYVGTSVKNCLEAIKNKLLIVKHPIFQLNENIAYLIKDHPERIASWLSWNDALIDNDYYSN